MSRRKLTWILLVGIVLIAVVLARYGMAPASPSTHEPRPAG